MKTRPHVERKRKLRECEKMAGSELTLEMTSKKTKLAVARIRM